VAQKQPLYGHENPLVFQNSYLKPHCILHDCLKSSTKYENRSSGTWSAPAADPGSSWSKRPILLDFVLDPRLWLESAGFFAVFEENHFPRIRLVPLINGTFQKEYCFGKDQKR